MRRATRLLVALALVPVASGCTKRIDLPLDSPAPAFQRASAALGSGPVDITLTDGQFVQWQGVYIGPELTTGLPLGATAPTAGAIADQPELKTNFIAMFQRRSRTKGALQGVPFGALVGVLMGFAVDPQELCEVDNPNCDITRAEAVVSMIIGGAGTGAIVGAILGARTEVRIR